MTKWLTYCWPFFKQNHGLGTECIYRHCVTGLFMSLSAHQSMVSRKQQYLSKVSFYSTISNCFDV